VQNNQIRTKDGKECIGVIKKMNENIVKTRCTCRSFVRCYILLRY